MEISGEIQKFLEGTYGIVEATTFEKHMLWVQNRLRDQPRTWKVHLLGHGATVGQLEAVDPTADGVGQHRKMPVCISLLYDIIDGRKILFWHATSRIVDYTMIEAWFERAIPASGRRKSDGRRRKTDANNFHIAFSED